MDKNLEETQPFQVTEAKSDNGLTSGKYLRRQVLVTSGVCINFFVFGLTLGTPTVFISQTRREANSSEAISREMSSWISSASSSSAIPNLFILTFVAKYFGRRITFLLTCVISAVGFITLYLSTSPVMVLISQIMMGPLFACDNTIGAKILTEYTSPTYRGPIFSFKSATFAWGILFANAVGIFFHWRNIAYIGFACTVYAFVTGIFWPESPYWLAQKQKYSDCARAHYWLKGTNEESLRELKSLINTHKELMLVKMETPAQRNISKFIKICLSPVFYKPFGCAAILKCLYQFCGKLSCNVYALQLLRKITNEESTAVVGVLIIDVVTVVSMYIMTIVVRFYRRKTLLLSTTLVGIAFLFIMSIYLYLKKLEMIDENNYLFLVLLFIYVNAISCGPMSLIQSMCAELCPVRYSGVYLLSVSLISTVIFSITLKILPFLVGAIGSHGLFFFYGITSLFLTILVYYFVPETKDTNMFDIDEIMRS